MAKKITLDDSKLMFGNQFTGKKKTTKKSSAKKSTKGKKK